MTPRNHQPKQGRPQELATPTGSVQRAVADTAMANAETHLPSENEWKAEVAALRQERKELQDALFAAAQVQRRLCAPRELRRGPFEIAGEMFAVRHLSGDFFQLLDTGPGVTLAVGDIAGKGLSAGLWMTHMVGLIRTHAAGQDDLAAALAAINRSLLSTLAEPPLVALFLGHLEPHTGVLRYANAGQPAALLLRQNQTMESLERGGPLLGAFANSEFECGRTALGPGDTLLVSSDGVIECRNPGDDEFGVERLVATARAASGIPAGPALFSTLGAVLDFAAGRPLEDDLTLLVARHAG